ncbi:Hypothetical predicted protein, partial [Paramuricea clavata]
TNLGEKKKEILTIPSHVFRTNLGEKKQEILTIPSHVLGFSLILSTDNFFNLRQVDQPSIMNVQFFLALVIVMGFVAGLEATCCKRKPDVGCCGNGPCNIFCCNCDGGCNEICEKTHCDTGDWTKCAGVLAACATACVDPADPACVACVGPLYNTCKKCFSSDVDPNKALADAKYMLNAYYKQNIRKHINLYRK